MAMNICHRLCCSSDRYFKVVEDALLPWVLGDVELGDSVLEIGPGYGANIRVLIDKAPHYTAVEIDQPMADRLKDKYGDRARIIRGDGTDTGLPSEEFSSVVCFTMLPHVPTTARRQPCSLSCIFATPATPCRRTRCLTGCAQRVLTMCMSRPITAGSAGARPRRADEQRHRPGLGAVTRRMGHSARTRGTGDSSGLVNVYRHVRRPARAHPLDPCRTRTVGRRYERRRQTLPPLQHRHRIAGVRGRRGPARIGKTTAPPC